MTARTLYEKLWESHFVRQDPDGTALIYIDRHLVHEVTSPQAFEGLALHGRKPWRIDSVVATADHSIPTTARAAGITDPIARLQVETLDRNVVKFHVKSYFGMKDHRQGIVHVIGPEQGATLPGMTVVCGDSHTSTHGAFGALAFGIGTSEVEHVLATQCLNTKKLKTMLIRADGDLPRGVTAKDLVLAIIGKIGTAGGTGYAIEFGGSALRAQSMEGRMTICNMSIEAGARAGVIAPDEVTFAYAEGRPNAPRGTAWAQALDAWRALPSDVDALFDTEVRIEASELRPYVSWGTNPSQTVEIDGRVPDPEALDASAREAAQRALRYKELRPGTLIRDIAVDAVFIGSCTNGRIEDLRSAAEVARGRRVRDGVRALVVPGSSYVKAQAEREGLDRVFRAAGFEWRDSGCSMCLGMNPDILRAGERCASTSNRNFEGRQGPGGRTHLVSPVVAAATAIAGHFTLPEDL